jgi:3-hydroxyisobutyrate dehydrogenase
MLTSSPDILRIIYVASRVREERVEVVIGYVGLGNMGGPLARRLLLGHALLVYDRDPVAVARLAESGATACSDLGELGSACDVVLLCLPTSDHVRAVIFGDGGLAGAMDPGTLIVDQTSGDPNVTRAIAAELAELDIDLVDAPVSGGARGAEAGTIAIMVGAAPEQYDLVEPILTTISPNVFHAGEVGTGHTIKLVNNLMSATQRLLTFEALALAAKNGMDPRRAVDILVASGGRNAYLEKIMGPLVLDGQLGTGFTLGLAHKDLRLACELGVQSGVPMFLGNLARELYQVHINEMGYDTKVDSAALVVDRQAGTHLVPAQYTLD